MNLFSQFYCLSDMALQAIAVQVQAIAFSRLEILFVITVGLLASRILPSQGFYVKRTTQEQKKTHICIHVGNGVGNRHPNVRALENSCASTSERVVTTKREYMRLDWLCKAARME